VTRPCASSDLADRGHSAIEDVERRLRSLLAASEGRLEFGTVYSIEVLRRPGAKAHDWFAGVQRADGYAKLNFLPMHGHPELLEGISPALLKAKTGASVFRFTSLDEALAAEVEALLARAYRVYTGEDR
jgi:hypothetical protein